ncbi:MAG: hypothetical protein U0871_24310 [Gemmataceae bacterium]
MDTSEPNFNRAIHCQKLVFNCRRAGGLDITQRMVLLALNDMIGSRNTHWTVCQKEIAERAGCGRTAVSKAINSLIKLGVLKASYRGATSAVLTYEIDPTNLVALQRPPRTPRPTGSSREQPAPQSEQAGCSRDEQGCSQDEQPAVRETNKPVRGTNNPVREANTLPSQAPPPPPPPGPSEGPLQSGAGWGPSDEQGVERPPLPRKSQAPLSHLEVLSPFNRSIILDVEKEVLLKELRSDPARVGVELNELLNSHQGVQATDIISVLTSQRFAGLRELSWGLILFTDKIFDRFNLMLREATASRVAAAAAGNTPLETIMLKLKSENVPDRLSAVNVLGDRFERTNDESWLVLLAAVFAGKGRDKLAKVRRHAIDRLHRLLTLKEPTLSPQVLTKLGAAVRKAADDEDLRIFAELVTEDYFASRLEACHA